MTVKHIPASAIYICDFCKKEYTSKAKMHFTVTGNGLDYLGDPASAIKVDIDACDSCYAKVQKYFESIRIKEEVK